MRILSRSEDPAASPCPRPGPRRSARALLPALLALAMLAMSVRAPAPELQAARLAGIAGQGSTGIQIVNMDTAESAAVSVDFYRQGGAPPVNLSLPSLAPLQAYNVYLPAQASLSNGAYSAMVHADREISTLTRTSWATSGASVTHGDARTATALIVPMVTRGYSGQSTILNVQNADPATDTTASIEVMASGSTTPAASTTVAISAGRSVSLDLYKNPSFVQLGDGFLGWARIRADVPLAAVAYNDIETSSVGVYTVDGVPESDLDATWLAPLVTNGYFGTSGINVLNPGSDPVEVSVAYTGVAGSCAGQTIDHDTATVGAGAIASFYQVDVLLPGTGRSHLPSGCAAAARISASGPVSALVGVTDVAQGTSASYPALRSDEAAPKLLLPLLRRNFYGTSTIQVANASTESATVTLEFADGRNGQGPFTACGGGCQVTIPAGGGHRWELASLEMIPDRSYGSGRLVSDRPILATVFESGSANTSGQRVSNDAVFNAVPIPASGTGPTIRPVPLALKSAGEQPPTPTPGTGVPSPTPANPPPTRTPDTRTGGGMVGAGISGFQVMNLSRTDAANISVSLQPYGGGAPVTISRSGVLPGTTATLYLPAEPSLANGAYAAHIRSDQPVDAMARTDWTATGGALIGNAAEAATELILPHLTHDYAGQTSIIGIHNTDAENATTVQLEILSGAQSAPHASLALDLGAGGSTLVDLDAHPDLAGLPSSLAGWARLSADRPIAAESFVNLRGTARGVYQVSAVPADSAASLLHAPMVFNDFNPNPDILNPSPAGGGAALTTGISVLNPGPDPVQVRLHYQGAATGGPANACAGQTIEHNDGAAATIQPGSSLTYMQSNMPVPGSGRSGLPEGCAASARIEATGGAVLALVNVANVYQTTSGAYPALPLAQGAGRVHLPLIRREHTTGGLTTAIMVQNMGSETAQVTVTLRDSRGSTIACGTDCEVTIPAGASRLWWPPAITTWPVNSYGTALIESDQPVAAVVDDLSLIGTFDQAVYVGLPEGDRLEADLPLLLMVARLGSTPTPAPSPTLAPTPTPTAAPPLLSLPRSMPGNTAGRLPVPLSFAAGGFQVAALEMVLDYDERSFVFDGTDADGDGLPDAIAVELPEDFAVTVEHRPEQAEGELSVRVSSLDTVPPQALPSGAWLTIHLDFQGGVKPDGWLRFAPGKEVRMYDLSGSKIPGRVSGGWSVTSERVAYFPALFRSQ